MPNFQGLTAKALTKYPPLLVSMILGFLDQQSRKNQRSTKPPLAPASTPPPASDTANNTELSNFPLSDHKNECTHHCFAAVFKPAVGKTHTNQMGRFVVASCNGSDNILVLYDYDSNSIVVEPMRNRNGMHILTTFFTVLHTHLITAGLLPLPQHLDNECSTALKMFLIKVAITYQVMLPEFHRRNAAERAICMLKNHCIASSLRSVDKIFRFICARRFSHKPKK